MLAAIGSVWQTHLMFSDTYTKTRIRDCQYECNRIIDNARKIECDFFFLLEKIISVDNETNGLMLSSSDGHACEMNPCKKFLSFS